MCHTVTGSDTWHEATPATDRWQKDRDERVREKGMTAEERLSKTARSGGAEARIIAGRLMDSRIRPGLAGTWIVTIPFLNREGQHLETILVVDTSREVRLIEPQHDGTTVVAGPHREQRALKEEQDRTALLD
jgi:hypothetical protein